MEIFKTFTFEAGHQLPNVPAGHKCGKLHGHSYVVHVYVAGLVDLNTGWIIDYADIKATIKPILDQLDHCYMNDIEGLENPTTEYLAVWIWSRLKPQLPELSKLIIQETHSSGCVYRGPEQE